MCVLIFIFTHLLSLIFYFILCILVHYFLTFHFYYFIVQHFELAHVFKVHYKKVYYIIITVK